MESTKLGWCKKNFANYSLLLLILNAFLANSKYNKFYLCVARGISRCIVEMGLYNLCWLSTMWKFQFVILVILTTETSADPEVSFDKTYDFIVGKQFWVYY